MVNDVPVFNKESKMRDVSGIWCVVQEYAAVKVFFHDREKVTTTVAGRRNFEVKNTRK